ncbi:MAG: protein kinase [Deltaproteobacteria bacterium]|nr:protein kinase [Deltaproteobacteria bacterium]
MAEPPTKLGSIAPKTVAALAPARDPRLEIRLPISVKVATVEQGYSGATANISKSGMFVGMREPLPVGARLDIEVVLERGQLLLHATAEVIRQQYPPLPVGVGVRFVDISYEAQELLERMVRDQRWFGDYRLETLIGRGGMAEVYRARAVAGAYEGRVVAIKRIRPELANDEVFAGLFSREAEITRALQHPNIVGVLDVGHKGDCCFIVLEYVDGIDLRRMIAECVARRIYLPIDFACYVANTVLTALDHAHHLAAADGTPYGLVHRDVSPGNVFISNDGDIKLGDFGVAQLQTHPERSPVLTGKPSYQPPEAFRDGRATPATDVFAVGAVLYELLTNTVAFAGKDRAQIYDKILDGAAVPPQKLRPEIPAPLAALVMRALSPTPPYAARTGVGALVRRLVGQSHPPRFADAASFAAALTGLYDHAIGNQLAIAAVVRGLLATPAGGRAR